MAATGDAGEGCLAGIHYPHVVLKLGHVLLDRGLLGEGPGQHELCLEDRPACIYDAVQGSRHPANQRGRCLSLTIWPVFCSNQWRLRSSVTRPSWTIRLPE